MSFKYVPVTQSMLCQIFLMYVRTREHFNYGGQQPKKQLAVYGSDTPVTLKQGQSHQTWYALVDPKQGYDNAKFEKPHLNNVCENDNNKGLVKSRNTSIISLEYERK